jgi:hypothetical protein
MDIYMYIYIYIYIYIHMNIQSDDFGFSKQEELCALVEEVSTLKEQLLMMKEVRLEVDKLTLERDNDNLIQVEEEQEASAINELTEMLKIMGEEKKEIERVLAEKMDSDGVEDVFDDVEVLILHQEIIELKEKVELMEKEKEAVLMVKMIAAPSEGNELALNEEIVELKEKLKVMEEEKEGFESVLMDKMNADKIKEGDELALNEEIKDLKEKLKVMEECIDINVLQFIYASIYMYQYLYIDICE